MKSNIRKLRNEREITQAELARVIGKTQQAVSQMEQDRERISIGSLVIMADYFDVSTDYILGIDEDRGSSYKKTDLSGPEWLQKGTEGLMNAIESGDNHMLYELILSLLLIAISGKSSQSDASSENTKE